MGSANDASGIERQLVETATALNRARDEYHALIVVRDELIFRLTDQGYSRAEIARMAGIRPHQVTRMITRRNIP